MACGHAASTVVMLGRRVACKLPKASITLAGRVPVEKSAKHRIQHISTSICDRGCCGVEVECRGLYGIFAI
jgi:hypothetical protein